MMYNTLSKFTLDLKPRLLGLGPELFSPDHTASSYLVSLSLIVIICEMGVLILTF